MENIGRARRQIVLNRKERERERASEKRNKKESKDETRVRIREDRDEKRRKKLYCMAILVDELPRHRVAVASVMRSLFWRRLVQKPDEKKGDQRFEEETRREKEEGSADLEACMA
jgi:hypothetical protein